MTGSGLRIIGGEWRGRRLTAPAGQDTRPTSARAREALFSMLVSRLGGFTGLQVADLYAGSGALGLEALSRGAACCTFVERERAALVALQTNIDAFRADARTRCIAGKVGSTALPLLPVDLAFFDPPYGDRDVAQVIERMAGAGWFGPGAWLSIETGHDQRPSPAGFAVDTVRDIGKARLTLLQALS